MYKTIVEEVLDYVSDYTDFDINQLLGSCRKEDIIDARHMAVYIMCQKLNIPRYIICSAFNITNANISYIIKGFNDRRRCRKYLNHTYQVIIKELEKKYPIMLR